MGSNAYLRFLARVAARQPRLRPPPDAALVPVSPSEYLALMPYTQPISGYRSRSFELRQLELRVAQEEDPPSCPRPTDASQAAPGAGAAAGPGGPDEIGRVGRSSPRAVRELSDHGASLSAAAAAAVAPAPAAVAPAATASSHDPRVSSQHPHAATPLLQPQSLQRGSTDVPGRGSPRSTSVAGAASVAGAGMASQPAAKAPATTPPHAEPPCPSPRPLSPPHSYMEVHFPFTSLPWLWHQYHRPGFPGLDPALIIEDFDTFAADVAARQVGHVPDSMLVTAFLERMTWHLQLRPGDGLVAPGAVAGAGSGAGGWGHPLAPLAPVDMRLAGQVTWVGRSSMEVLLQLTTVEPLPGTAAAAAGIRCAGSTPVVPGNDLPGDPPPTQRHPHAAPTSSQPMSAQASPSAPAAVRQAQPLVVLPPGQLLASAEFVMALRDTSLKRAVDVPPLHPRDDLERELFLRGREHQRQRQARRDRDRGDAGAGGGGGGGGGAAAPRPGSPARAAHSGAAVPGPSAAAAVPELAAAAHDAPPELARMLYDVLEGSEERRSAPAHLDALGLLDPGLDLDVDLDLDGTDVEEDAAVGEGRDTGENKRHRFAGGEPARPISGLVQPLSEEPGHHRRRKRPRVGGLEPAMAALVGASGDQTTSAQALPVPIRQTQLHRTVLAEFQDRNTSGTVFGGHLLRLAYEQAAAAAAAFAGAPCELMWLEEAAISAPARVGDVLHAVSRVVWAERGGRALRVVVRLGKYDIATPSQHVLALTLAATFLAPSPLAAAAEVSAGAREREEQGRGRQGLGAYGGGGGGEESMGGLRGVVPTTLAEAAEALAAQRRHEGTMAALAAAEAADSAGAVAAAGCT